MAKKDKIILKEIEEWYNQDIIEENLYIRLSSMYQKNEWDLTTIIKWTLVIGAVMVSLGLISFIALIVQSEIFSVIILSALCLSGYYYGFKLKRRDFKYYFPKTGDALIAISCLILAADIFMINQFIFNQFIQGPTMIGLISIIYLFIAYFKQNNLVLVFSLLGFATWFGAETGYISGWGVYFLGLNYPMRFALISPMIILIGYFHKKLNFSIPESFIRIYYSFGLLFLNLSLWILSIFGNQGSLDNWGNNTELLFFSILWGIVNVIIFLIGSKFKDKMFVGYAITFIILNLYTRYFEYFWDEIYKSLFFIVLGGMSIIIGLYFENKLSE
ncbi:putative membrane protein [Halanaerobium saccharolyticum]|uniref:Putative membrane protein n=1 Tax=Halanaerobium saccharolyticum TaxID=43595 RepID=A0A4R7YRT7_9FIRM|nr:DUF2157 domain-containing protein [Halanaerobium saccharolyticum]RAK10245.1 putative membrane protein [Halanaerobium saccharolyticum]TDW00457.1 putative membrane protein [Halanaerobium saccharolyticum]TDX52042.1 putative membrane protein [Halanaerobium saccharolyticum]